MDRKILAYLALFTSLGTLVCCALPALFVALGFGAAFVTLLSAAPQLIWLSEHKTAVFVTSGALLLAAAAAARTSRECPIEGPAAQACAETKVAGKIAFRIALAAYAVGGFFAYIAPALSE